MSAIVLISAGHGPICRWIRRLTRSPYGHVAVSVGGIVLNPTVDGDTAMPLSAYLMAAPRLRAAFFLPGPDPVLWVYDIDRHPWRSFVRALTRGLWPETNDCITTTRTVLAAMGHSCPRWVTTPARLHEWLESQGFHHATFARVSSRTPGVDAGDPEGEDAQLGPDQLIG